MADARDNRRQFKAFLARVLQPLPVERRRSELEQKAWDWWERLDHADRVTVHAYVVTKFCNDPMPSYRRISKLGGPV